ncbi:MAG: DUF481 domain-containing protein [Candidatus Omnitrophica bacterium]|nr:DUF481 domain-containing protein [Candidatus Omnitrophota bacterium]MCG2714184.1 DUF481 domain-containing protein [Candidatus Omnitrophota bacterium]
MKMNWKYFYMFMILNSMICLVLFSHGPLYAEPNKDYTEVYLKNGDRISGKVIWEDDSQIKIDNNIIGIVSIKRTDVKDIVYYEESKISEAKGEKPGIWLRDISIGYDKSSGNTKNSNLTVRLYGNRKTDADEFTIKGDMFYSSADNKMDAQKWYGMVRYAYSFHKSKWYNFYKFEGDHDRFANIDYRLIPSVGIGYWFFDTPAWKAMTELGIGLEHTNFRQGSKNKNEVVLIPRVFFEKGIFDKSRITQDIILYPSLTESGEYRLHSETAFISPINKKLSLCFSFIDDYNSNPCKDTKKNDTRFISSLSYSF